MSTKFKLTIATILITTFGTSFAICQENASENREGQARYREELRIREKRVAETQERLQKMENRIRELREAGKSEAVEELLREFNSVREQLGKFKGSLEEHRGRSRVENRMRELPEEIRKRFEGFRRELAELREKGKLDAVERVEKQLQEFTRRVRREFGEQNTNRESKNAEKTPEQRLKHLRAAVEHLRAAGLLDQAENVARQIGRFEKEIEERNRNRERENRERREGENRERENRERENRERENPTRNSDR